MAGRRFDALDEYLDDSLTLPGVKGVDGTVREYTIPAPSAEDGLRIQRIMTSATRAVQAAESNQQPLPADSAVLDDEAESDLFTLALGKSLFDDLKAEVSWPTLKHIAMTAVMWITADLDTAERFWTTGGAPSQPAPNRAARRAEGSSAAASKTRSRGSTSGTKAPRRKQADADAR